MADKELLNISTSSIGSILQDFGNEMQKELQQSLKKGGKFGNQIVSAELYQSINFSAKIFGSTFKFQLTLADYYDFVDKGVKGYSSAEKAPNSPYKWGTTVNGLRAVAPSPKDLSGWANHRQLNPFAVARAVARKGTYGSGFFDRVVTTKRLEQLQSDLSAAARDDIEALVVGTAKGIFGVSR